MFLGECISFLKIPSRKMQTEYFKWLNWIIDAYSFSTIFCFFIFASLQAVIILTYVLFLVSFTVTPMQIFAIGVVTILMTLVGLILGLLASFISNNEFHAIQVIPLVTFPLIFLSDMIWDIEGFPLGIQLVSYLLPLTHTNSAMRDIFLKNYSL